MPYSLDDKLVVGISSRALFDLDEEDHIYRTDGLAAYRAVQREREEQPLRPGTGFRLVQGLLAINNRIRAKRLVEVIILSKNDGDSGARIFNSIEHHGLDITRAAFTGGRGAARFLHPFRCHLFLSAEAQEVAVALAAGFPAALVLAPPTPNDAAVEAEVLIAFDGDAVLFDDEAEQINQAFGLEAFVAHEKAHATNPMNPGPFEPFLRALARLQAEFAEGEGPIRTALVTARSAPAHRRVINTLRAWGVRIDESYFLGGIEKAEILRVLRPLIFFDDQLVNLARVQSAVPAAHVPFQSVQVGAFDDPLVAKPVKFTELTEGPTAEGQERGDRELAPLDPSSPGSPDEPQVAGLSRREGILESLISASANASETTDRQDGDDEQSDSESDEAVSRPQKRQRPRLVPPKP